MAITGYDSILAALSAGKGFALPFSYNFTSNAVSQGLSSWAFGDIPTAGVLGSAGYVRACYNTTQGALPGLIDASGTDSNYITAVEGLPSQSLGTLIFYDRVADVSGINLAATGTTAFTSPAWPRYTSGAGLQMFLEVTSTVSGAPSIIVNYHNQAGAGSRSTASVTCAANGAGKLAYANSIWLPLQAGDSGVSAVDSVAVVAGAGGACALVIGKPLFTLPLVVQAAGINRDLVTQTPRIPMLPNGACIASLLFGASTTAGVAMGSVSIVQA